MVRITLVFVVMASLFLSDAAFATGGESEGERDLVREIAEIRLEMEKMKADLAADDVEAKKRVSRNAPVVESAPPIKVSGEIRIREEILHDYYRAGDAAATAGRSEFDFTLLRTRLRFDVEVEDDLDVVIELQDVRFWGEELTTVGLNQGTSGVDIKRAEFLLHNAGVADLTFEAGRFVMAYGDQRLIGHLEWANQGRTYDGVRFQFAPEGFFADIFAVRITDSNVNDNNDQDLIGLYGGKKDITDFLGAEGYLLWYRDNRRPLAAVPLAAQESDFVTIGTRVFGEMNGFDYTGELAYQRGKVGLATLSAHAYALTGGFTFPDISCEPRVGVVLAHATGNRSGTDGDTEQFQNLFPTNHGHYGVADLMNWSNMWDTALVVSAKPREDMKATLALHTFHLDDVDGGWQNAGGAVLRNNAGGTTVSEHVGEEFDLVLAWKATAALSVLGGYAHFFAGDYLEDTGASRDSDWFFLQARVVF